MYSCTLWAGAPLTFPTMNEGSPVPNKDWLPLYGGAKAVPGFWWFLLDRFNFFWRSCGAPIFVVERMSALSRADSRFALCQDVLSDEQRHAWHAFRDCLGRCSGELFLVELSVLWQQEYGENEARLETYLNSCLLPFGRSNANWKKLRLEQKSLLCTDLFAAAQDGVFGLTGDDLAIKAN